MRSIARIVAGSDRRKRTKEPERGEEQLDRLEALISASCAELNILSIPEGKNTVLKNANIKQCYNGSGNIKKDTARHLDKI